MLQFPGWNAQLALLETLLQDGSPNPPGILVLAPHSPERALSLVQTAVHTAAPAARVAYTSPHLTRTPGAFFADAVRQLGGGTAADMTSFLSQLHTLDSQVVLVVSDAQRMRDLWPETLWLALPQLAGLAGMAGRVSVVFVSSLPWSSFRTAAGDTVSVAPLCIRLQRLGSHDAIALLAADYVPGSDELRRYTELRDLSSLHRSYVGLLYDSVHTSVRDEQVLRLVSAAIWRVLAAAVQLGFCAPTIAGIRARFSELLRDALATPVPRAEGPAEWAARREADIIQKHGQSAEMHDANNTPTSVQRTGYPVFGAVLLLAAFLASYNPTNTDVKYYVRELGASRTRRRRRTKASAADAALDELEGEREVWVRRR